MEILVRGTGKSSGDAMAMMESLASKLPSGIGYDWTGLSYQERFRQPGSGSLCYLPDRSILCLAALYESWSIPFSVMLVGPLGVSVRFWRQRCVV